MKQFSKIKHLADKAFIRPGDRTEVLSEDLQAAERRIELIRQTCESTTKKVAQCLQCPSKDGQPMDKRIKKVPEVALGLNMVVNGRQLGTSESGSVLGEVLTEAGGIEMKVGHEMVAYEVQVEELILGPLQKLMDNDLASINKIKRTLSKLTSDMDTARAKLNQASRHSMSGATTGKIDNIKDDLEDTQQKVEQCRDNLAAEMYQLIARESEISRYIVEFLQHQRDYHRTIYSVVNELLPHVESILANSYHKPVYGGQLDDHLQGSSRTIAYVVELCVCGLIITGLEEEGLFRIAGSASKVKKLKAAFDAGLMDLKGLITEFCDPHVIANALKCYLRELKVPLLTFDLYQEWVDAIQTVNNQERLQSLWTVVQKLQKSHTMHFDNLRYLIKFLSELSKHHSVNKMTPANIAIVIGPNLLWTQNMPDDPIENGPQIGLNMTMTHLYTSLLDQLVTYADYFFPDDIDFFVTCTRPTDAELVLANGIAEDPNQQTESEACLVSAKRSQSNSSLEDHNNSPPPGSPKPVLRRKNKPAPVPPVTPVIKSSGNKVQPTTESVKPLAATAAPAVSSTIEAPSTKVSDHSDGMVLKRVSSTKRDGMWIPPSPNQMHNRKLVSSSNPSQVEPKMTPPKPPQPQFTQNLAAGDRGDGGRETNLPNVQHYATTLRHKSSFNSGVGSSSTTDNGAGGPASSSSAMSNSPLQYSSLPRHFHTDNSFKNQRAPRPPSVFAAETTAAPPPPPPTVPQTQVDINSTKATTVPAASAGGGRSQQQDQAQQPSPMVAPSSSDRDALPQPESVFGSSNNNSILHQHRVGTSPPGGVSIGFENLETEVRRASEAGISSQPIERTEESSVVNHVGQPTIPSLPVQEMSRPVPAPRSSLFGGSNVKDGGERVVPVVKERPSLMAKPRDLQKRAHTNSGSSTTTTTTSGYNEGASGTELKPSSERINNSIDEVNFPTTNIAPSQALHASSSIDSNLENPVISDGPGLKNGGIKDQISPNSPRIPYRPPRPHPPPPPKGRAESTDL